MDSPTILSLLLRIAVVCFVSFVGGLGFAFPDLVPPGAGGIVLGLGVIGLAYVATRQPR